MNSAYRGRLLAARLVLCELSMGSSNPQALDEARFTASLHPDWLTRQSALHHLGPTPEPHAFWDWLQSLTSQLSDLDQHALGIQP